MEPSDDPQMLVGTAVMVLHAVGAHHINEQIGPFGMRSIQKALDSTGDDMMIGAVCQAFDDASGISGYGAVRVAQLKAQADAGARSVYSGLIANKVHPIQAIRRAADAYGLPIADTVFISKSLSNGYDLVSEAACDKKLLAWAAFIAEAEHSVIRKDKDTFQIKGRVVTVNRDPDTGEFASQNIAVRTPEEKAAIRRERMKQFMVGQQRRKNEAPERAAQAEAVRVVEQEAEQEEVAPQVEEEEEEAAEYEAAPEAEKARMRRRKKAAERRRKAGAAAAGRLRGGAAGAMKFEVAAGERHIEQQRAKQNMAQRSKVKQKAAEHQARVLQAQMRELHVGEENEQAEDEAVKEQERVHEQKAQRRAQVKKFKEQFDFFNPHAPNRTNVLVRNVDLGAYGKIDLTVPMLMRSFKGSPRDAAPEPDDVVAYLSGVDPGQYANIKKDARTDPQAKVLLSHYQEQAALTYQMFIEAKYDSNGVAGVLSSWTYDKPRKPPPTTAQTQVWPAQGPKLRPTVRSRAQEAQYLQSIHDNKARYRLYRENMALITAAVDQTVLNRWQKEYGQDSKMLKGKGLVEHHRADKADYMVGMEFKDAIARDYGGNDEGLVPLVAGGWHGREDDVVYHNESMLAGNSLFPNTAELLATVVSDIQSHKYQDGDLNTISAVAALARAGQMIEMTAGLGDQNENAVTLQWRPSFQISLDASNESMAARTEGVLFPEQFEPGMDELFDAQDDDEPFTQFEAEAESRVTIPSPRNSAIELNGAIIPSMKTEEPERLADKTTFDLDGFIDVFGNRGSIHRQNRHIENTPNIAVFGFSASTPLLPRSIYSAYRVDQGMLGTSEEEMREIVYKHLARRDSLNSAKDYQDLELSIVRDLEDWAQEDPKPKPKPKG